MHVNTSPGFGYLISCGGRDLAIALWAVTGPGVTAEDESGSVPAGGYQIGQAHDQKQEQPAEAAGAAPAEPQAEPAPAEAAAEAAPAEAAAGDQPQEEVQNNEVAEAEFQQEAPEEQPAEPVADQ